MSHSHNTESRTNGPRHAERHNTTDEDQCWSHGDRARDERRSSCAGVCVSRSQQQPAYLHHRTRATASHAPVKQHQGRCSGLQAQIRVHNALGAMHLSATNCQAARLDQV